MWLIITNRAEWLPAVKVGVEAGSWFEEAPTQELKPTQRCHACWNLPDEKKKLSDRQHTSARILVMTCGRDENAALVLLRWLEAGLSGVESGDGREPSEVWSGCGLPALKHETHAIAGQASSLVQYGFSTRKGHTLGEEAVAFEDRQHLGSRPRARGRRSGTCASRPRGCPGDRRLRQRLRHDALDVGDETIHPAHRGDGVVRRDVVADRRKVVPGLIGPVDVERPA